MRISDWSSDVCSSDLSCSRPARRTTRPPSSTRWHAIRRWCSDAATLAKLENARAYVPGERVTAAQAAPSPRAVMVEKALRNRPDMKAQFVDQDLANNDLRVDVLRRMAGTDEALETAVKARREAAGAFANDRLQPGDRKSTRLNSSH